MGQRWVRGGPEVGQRWSRGGPEVGQWWVRDGLWCLTVDVRHVDGELDEVGVVHVVGARVPQLGREWLRPHRAHHSRLAHPWTHKHRDTHTHTHARTQTHTHKRQTNTSWFKRG